MTQTPAPDWRTQRPWLSDAVFCDGLLPWTAEFLPPRASLPEQLVRFHDQGCDHISLTVAAGRDGPEVAMARYGFLLRELRRLGERVQIAANAAAVRQARHEGRLSIALHFQSATLSAVISTSSQPFDGSGSPDRSSPTTRATYSPTAVMNRAMRACQRPDTL